MRRRNFLRVFGAAALACLLWLAIPARAQQTVSFPDPNLEAAVRQALQLPTGDLTPAVLQNLTSLSAYSLGITNLSGLEAATSLTALYVGWNSISDFTPLEGLAGLLSLDVSYAGVKSLSQLGGLTNLVSLTASANSLASLNGVERLTQLSSLSLGQNNLARLQLLAGLTNLAYLDLGSNPLDSGSPVPPLPNLVSLTMSSCSLSNLAFLQNLTGLQTLYLGYNSLRDVSPLQGLTNLATLDLSGNAIACVTPLTGLPALTSINMSSCSLGSVACLRNLTSLQTLYLSYNAVRDISPLQGLTNLSTADLSGNPILCVAPLAGLPGLTTLTLSRCSLSNLVCLQGLSSLRQLSLGNNAVTDVSPISGLTNLNYLDLSSNPVSSVEPLAGLPTLTTLLLPNCSLSNLASLHELKPLRSLYLANNGIRDLAPLSSLTNLNYLYLGGNSITNVTPLSSLPRLTTLDLGNSGFSNLTSVANLYPVRSLIVDYNGISDLSPLTSLTNLYSLSLPANRITTVDALTNLARLHWVNLMRNLVDLATNSPAMNVITQLQSAGVSVSYDPQNQPPTFILPLSTNWAIRPNVPAELSLEIADDVTAPSLVTLTVSSSDPGLVPSTVITLVRTRVYPTPPIGRLVPPLPPFPPILPPGTPTPLDLIGFPQPQIIPLGGAGVSYWTLSVTPSSNLTGTATLTLTATDDTALSNSLSIHLTVAAPLPLDGATLNTTNLAWQTGGNTPWYTQTTNVHDGISAAQAGSVSIGESSWLETTVTGPGILSFWWRTASTGAFLTFGTSQGGSLWLQGNTEWEQVAVSLPPGSNVLHWEFSAYYPAYGQSTALDAAWVDQVSFTPTQRVSWIEFAPPVDASSTRLALHAEPGGLYEVQGSSDLHQWSTLGRVVFDTLSDGFHQIFTDARAPAAAGFYRLRALPAETSWLDPIRFDAAGSPYVVMCGKPGRVCELWSSTNLVEWQIHSTVTNATGRAGIIDSLAGPGPRFYRARVP